MASVDFIGLPIKKIFVDCSPKSYSRIFKAAKKTDTISLVYSVLWIAA
ncbi:hypothetical protein [Bartonella quintana]|nr:hypothetical protein [Bartonella quintana]